MSNPTERRPHILLITTDQQRSDCLGINGNHEVETPNLDALARNGVNFRKGYVTCPVCIPARRTLISGMSPDSHGLRRYLDGVDFDPPATLPGCLKEVGYQTELIGKLHLHPQGKRYGFDNITLSETANWRPDHPHQKRNDYVRWLQEKGVTRHPTFQGIGSNSRLSAPWGMDDTLHWNQWVTDETVKLFQQRRDPTCPLFLHLSFFHPHPPFIPLKHYFDRYLEKDLSGPVIGEWAKQGEDARAAPDAVAGPFDEGTMKRAKAAYYALINHIDDCIAHILEQWTNLPDVGNDPLYIIFSSDHGEMLGDHHLFRKSQGYEASAHVPFFLSGINVDLPSMETDDFVSWEDVAPTLLDLAGVVIPPSMDGRSLVSYLDGKEPDDAPDHIFGQCFGRFANLWVVNERWKYIWFAKTNEEQLFDLQNDPRETRDLSGTNTENLQAMRKIMEGHVSGREDVTFDESALSPCANQPPKVFWPN
ncbi:sulfatase-like hydrolase/transferase [Puniceicoccus vermicola]|nr:sulfatase-like hydrolase/transferase [Puniceicoccus vermicola]